MGEEESGLALVLGGLDDVVDHIDPMDREVGDDVGTPKLSRVDEGKKAAEHACARRVRRVITSEDASDDELVSALRDAFSILSKKKK